MIESNDRKAIEMVIELKIRQLLANMTAMDIEDTLEMDFDDYADGAVTTQEVIREYRMKKGI